jgi:nucleotide-binding universal stress UspA family protein
MTDMLSADRIVVAVDGSEESDAALRWAAHEAQLRHLDITVAHVMAPVVVSWPIPPAQAEISQWQEQIARQVTAGARKLLHACLNETKLARLHTTILRGQVVPTLVDTAKNARMLVVGSRGMGAFGRGALGSVSSGVVHRAQCPVAILHADQAQSFDRTSPIVLGIDGSPASEAATTMAFDEASRRGVDLVAVHAWSDVGVFPLLGMDWHQNEDKGREVLGERLAGWQERYPDVCVRRRIVCDRPARWLIEESGQAQLVVVGSRGRGGFPGMHLGSVSIAVAESALAPVIVVPA